MEAAETRGGGAGAALGGARGCGCKGIRSCLRCEAAPPPQLLRYLQWMPNLKHVAVARTSHSKKAFNWFTHQRVADPPCVKLVHTTIRKLVAISKIICWYKLSLFLKRNRYPLLYIKKKSANFVYCPLTGFAVGEKRSEFEGWAFQFPGVFLLEDFISTDEECEMVELMDQSVWKPSQSGRRKQDYGPKVNFKKQKLKAGNFSGLPSFSKEIVARMRSYTVLEGFSPVEQCNLDYDPERGSAIDPHWDDWWLWGERLVSLNLLSETVLSMSCDSEDSLQLLPLFLQEDKQIQSYQSPDISQEYQYNDPTLLKRLGSTECSSTKLVPFREITVAIYLPRRSLVVLSGPARYQWKHAIYRNHIKSRRVCITFRELTAEFSLGGEQEELGKNLLEIALTFKGSPV